MSKKQKTAEPRFVNRELSWIGFNRRVLEQAFNREMPLLDRVKFLAITAGNLDEFFMVRVGSLKYAVQKERGGTDPSGMTPREQLAAIREEVLKLNEQQDRCLLEELDPRLAEAGIVRLDIDSVSEEQFRYLRHLFQTEIVSAISPIAIANRENIPVLKGARLCVCVRIAVGGGNQLSRSIRPDVATETPDSEKPKTRFVLIPLPTSLPRVMITPSETGVEYVFIEDIVGLFVQDLFPGEEILEWTTLRVTRNADFELDDDTDDFVSEMKQLLDWRETSQCVRLRVAGSTSQETLEFLIRVLGISETDAYVAQGPLDLSSLFAIANLPGYQELRSPDWPQIPVVELQEPSEIFERIADQDVIVFHPYQGFDPVVDLLEQAARDPAVIAIKQTLYRTSRSSKIVKALVEASENGKHVTVVVELKARFDEERNLDWAKYLENAGVDVVYGIAGLKVHAKLSIVVRREATGIRRYLHFGTGNYNEATSRLYSDISLFTAETQLGVDAVHAFNAITGLSTPQEMEKLRLAPINLRETLVDLIRNEAANARTGGVAAITAKLNSLVDPAMINELYEASQAGVKIRLNVRGICCLRPGVPGLSENIEVISVVDRFLEHARILHFHHGGDQKLFITSADWMGRNLDRRIELLVPVLDPVCRQRLLDVLQAYFQGNVNVWAIRGDGSHKRVKRGKAEPFRPQEYLYEWFSRQFQNSADVRSSVFKAIRGKD